MTCHSLCTYTFKVLLLIQFVGTYLITIIKSRTKQKVGVEVRYVTNNEKKRNIKTFVSVYMESLPWRFDFCCRRRIFLMQFEMAFRPSFETDLMMYVRALLAEKLIPTGQNGLKRRIKLLWQACRPNALYVLTSFFRPNALHALKSFSKPNALWMLLRHSVDRQHMHLRD